MLEWKPRLAILIVLLVSLASVLSTLHTGGGTGLVNHGW
jgi:hypothetical protein